MAKFKNDKGLTLIELLITIAVLAVVSAIALPVINNVVSSSNSNAAAQTQSDVDDFIAKYNAAGETLVSTDGRTLQGFVDTDGDNTIDSNELVDTLTIDAKFSFSAAGSSDFVGGNYTADGITGATTGLASAGGAPTNGGGSTYPGTEFLPGDFNSTAIVYGAGGGSAIAYHSFPAASNSQAFMSAIQSGSSQWTATVVNGSQSITYALNRSGSGEGFSPDWGNYVNGAEAQAVIPNFSYTIAKIYVDAAAQKLTFILN